MKNSKGHIGKLGDVEVFERDGQIYFAPLASPIQTDGYRHGRWECSRIHFDRNRSIVYAGVLTN